MGLFTGNANFNSVQLAVRRTFLGACAIGMLIAAPSVSAAGCTWLYAGNGTLEHSIRQGRYVISFSQLSQNNSTISAKVKLDELRSHFSGWEYLPVDTGEAKGNIQGNVLSFVIAWSSGAKGDYKGEIDIYGNVAGTTVDVQHPESTASWTMGGWSCVPNEPVTTTPESSAPKKIKGLGKRKIPLVVKEVDRDIFKGVAPKDPPAQPPQQMATARNDVDIYDGPDGNDFNVIGMMGAGSTAPVLGHKPGWYQLQLNVRGGSGWVAEDHLTIKP